MLTQVMAWHRTDGKPLPGPRMTQFIGAHILHPAKKYVQQNEEVDNPFISLLSVGSFSHDDYASWIMRICFHPLSEVIWSQGQDTEWGAAFFLHYIP